MNGSNASITHRFNCKALNNIANGYLTEMMRIVFSNRNTQPHSLKWNSQEDVIEMYSIPYSRNIDVELNLAVLKINFALPSFSPSTLLLILALKTLNAYTLILKHIFQIAPIV